MNQANNNTLCRMLLLALALAARGYSFVITSRKVWLPRAKQWQRPCTAALALGATVPTDDSGFAIDDSIRNTILQSLHEIEKESDVKILYACESGSRAWGFPSKDSDYDVRFIYVHPLEYYLSIDFERKKRDVIEMPIEGDLDINGWDLRKALHLFRKSNPPLKEWLGSPIVYLETDGTIQKLRDLTESSYSQTSCLYHYYSWTKRNIRSMTVGDKVKTKKYFYVLRPLLAIIWMEKGYGPVPTEFQTLVEATLPNGDLKDAIYQLIEDKRAGTELNIGPSIPEIDDFINSQLARLDAKGGFERDYQEASAGQLNALFQDTLDRVWKSPSKC